MGRAMGLGLRKLVQVLGLETERVLGFRTTKGKKGGWNLQKGSQTEGMQEQVYYIWKMVGRLKCLRGLIKIFLVLQDIRTTT